MVRSALTIAVMLACVGGAQAETCRFITQDGSWAEIDGPMSVTFHNGDAATVCAMNSTGTGSALQALDCEDGLNTALFFAPSTVDGEGEDLMIARNEVWYRDGCK